MDLVLFHQEGSFFGDFKVTHAKRLDEIQTTLLELEHEPTGAQVLCLLNQDPENLFNISFKTYPDSSNGVAHILEHTVLCGSKKFPIKDPFFGMQKRSLATFMNAMTGSDFTCYPASSMHEKDFYNLLEVYLDAVFYPTLSKLSFLQEGHRLELEKGRLVNQGIVFNEMKGAMSDPEARLHQTLHQALFPESIYRFNSGGDPKQIASIQYKDLKNFHKTFYHPSNALFFFYGSFPIEKHLRFLQDYCLKAFEKKPPLQLKNQKPLEKEVRVQQSYPIGSYEKPEDKHFLAFGFVTCQIVDQVDVLTLGMLDIIFCGTDAGLLKKAILDTKLCHQVDSDFDSDMSQIPWILVCKGVDPQKKKELEKVVFAQLKRWIDQPIDPDLIEAALHQLELNRLEIVSGSSPYGLHLYFRSGLLKQHEGVPEEALEIHHLFDQLKQRMKDPHYLGSFIQKFLYENPHRTIVDFVPDVTLLDQENQREKQVLKKMYASLSQFKKEELEAQKIALQEYQEAEDKVDVLPSISLRDIPIYPADFIINHVELGEQSLYCHKTFTNKMLYFELVFDLPKIALEDLKFLRFFTYLAPQMGTRTYPFDQFLDLLLRYTGGLFFHTDFYPQVNDFETMNPKVMLKSKCLERHHAKAIDLVFNLIQEVDFTNKKRLAQLLKQHYLNLQTSLSEKAVHYGLHLASSAFSQAGQMNQHLWGIDYYTSVKPLLENLDEHLDFIIGKLQQIQASIFSRFSSVVVTASENFCEKISEKLKVFEDLNFIPQEPWSPDYIFEKPGSQAVEIASSVAYNVFALPTVSYTDRENPYLALASQILEDEVLHSQIREQGGAYGAGCSNSTLPSYFYCYSYRDPHVGQTFEVYEKALQGFLDFKIDDQILNAAKFNLIQDLDSPIAPGSRGAVAYNRLASGNTFENRVRYRQGILKASESQLKEAFESKILAHLDEGIRISFAPKKLLTQNQSYLEKHQIQVKTL